MIFIPKSKFYFIFIFRPIEVVLDIMISDLQAHLIKNCLPDDPPCPFLMVEKLAFEMDKHYRETRLQLQLSPVVLRSGHLEAKNELSQGHMLLTGLQFRGHAMFRYGLSFPCCLSHEMMFI